MINYDIIDLECRDTRWQVLMQDAETGMRHAHIFPHTVFQIRSAEYDIDPDDIETLLDIVLHEPHIPEPTFPHNHAADAGLLAGHTVQDNGVTVPAWLYNANTIVQARSAHLERIRHVKENVLLVRTQPGDLLDAIREAHSPDAEFIATTREHVLHTRRLIAKAQAPDPKNFLPRKSVLRDK